MALYDRDFVLWTEEQAAALRRTKESNLPLDWENLAEEIESLGKSDRRALSSQIRRILHHLFKMEASPASEPRAGWRSTIRTARAEIEDILRDSPSLRRQIDAANHVVDRPGKPFRVWECVAARGIPARLRDQDDDRRRQHIRREGRGDQFKSLERREH